MLHTQKLQKSFTISEIVNYLNGKFFTHPTQKLRKFFTISGKVNYLNGKFFNFQTTSRLRKIKDLSAVVSHLINGNISSHLGKNLQNFTNQALHQINVQTHARKEIEKVKTDINVKTDARKEIERGKNRHKCENRCKIKI